MNLKKKAKKLKKKFQQHQINLTKAYLERLEKRKK